MKKLCTALCIAILSLTLISYMSPMTSDSSLHDIRRPESHHLSEGSTIVTVSEDISVLNGSYADTNFNSDSTLYLGTGFDGSFWYAGRSWFKFNLSDITSPFYRAVLYVHVMLEFALPDESIGVYYCANDTWSNTTMTWNNQPTFSAIASDTIDSPASPNMFVANNWYGYEITNDVRATLSGDKILTEVLRQTVETGTMDAMDALDRLAFVPQYAAYIELFFANPIVENLTTNGLSDSPLIDYIQDPTPTLSWEFTDPDVGDYQTMFTIEVWDSEYYNDTRYWNLTSVTPDTFVDYGGPRLNNNTTYFWRVQACDSHGFWSNWTGQSFTYNPLIDGPSYEGPLIIPAVVYVGTQVTVIINVTYFLGVESVDISFGGESYPMIASEDTYSYSWNPTEAGLLNYTITMESVLGRITTVEGSIDVLTPETGDITNLLIIGGVAAVVVVVLSFVLRRRGKPE